MYKLIPVLFLMQVVGASLQADFEPHLLERSHIGSKGNGQQTNTKSQTFSSMYVSYEYDNSGDMFHFALYGSGATVGTFLEGSRKDYKSC